MQTNYCKTPTKTSPQNNISYNNQTLVLILKALRLMYKSHGHRIKLCIGSLSWAAILLNWICLSTFLSDIRIVVLTYWYYVPTLRFLLYVLVLLCVLLGKFPSNFKYTYRTIQNFPNLLGEKWSFVENLQPTFFICKVRSKKMGCNIYKTGM